MRQLVLALGCALGAGFSSAAWATPGFMLSDLPVVIGAIDEDLVTHVIWTHQMDIRACYEEGLTRKPELAGRMEIKLSIGDEGVVSHAETRATTLGDEQVEDCIIDQFYGMDFPSPSRGVALVTVKFTFQPL